MILYDPDDPYKDWYDFDDGMCYSIFIFYFTLCM
jgi:hypothetical protein